MAEVQLYFVLPKGVDTDDDCDSEMQQAYGQCEQHRSSGIAAEWITEDQCASKVNLTKRDVFVLQEFKGALFNKLLKTKAVIVGARCLSCCLIEGSQIPPGPHPVYTVAMRGLIITTTGLDKEQKDNIRKKVLWMGGTYDNVLTVETTHLISNTIFSDKYNTAVSTKIPILHNDWIEAVWEASLKQNVSAADSQFDKHKLPTFYGAIMTTSGFSKQEKKKIVNLINENGGTFKGDFESISTDVVIMNSESVGGSKYKAAMEYDKYCVLPSWIYESAARGCALNPDHFKVYENKTSSPYMNGNLPDMSLNLSTITNLRNPVASSVDETCSSTVSSESSKLLLGNNTKDVTSSQRGGRPSRICPLAKEIGLMMDSIEMKDVKLAGPFLDGCCIYVYGTSVTRRDKVHRIVSRCGGVRYDSPHASVTHVLSGDPAGAGPGPAERSAMPRAAHLSLRWLVDSLKARKQLEESQYLVSSSDKSGKAGTPGVTMAACASPMSKRNLQLLQDRPARPPVPLFNLDRANEQEKDDIVQQYMTQSQQHSKIVGDSEDALAEYFKQGGGSFKDQNATVTSKTVGDASANDVTVTTTLRVKMGNDKSAVVELPSQTNEASNRPEAGTMTEMMDDLSEIFNGITFELQGMEEITATEVAVNIEASGGTVLPIGHGGEYVVVPLDYDEAEVLSINAKIVTTFWLDDCLSQEEIVGIEYYHKPVKMVGDTSPLSEQVLGISTYVGVERAFIDELAQLLGAKTQLTFCRRNTETSCASTHLICPEAKGDKYRGAVKWGLPAVSCQWLLACAAQGRRLREGPFLIGDTKEPIWKEEEISMVAETTTGDGEKTCADFNKENVSIKDTTVSTTDPPTKELDDITAVEELDNNDMTRAEVILMRERLSDDTCLRSNTDKVDNISISSDSVSAPPQRISAGVLSENTPKGLLKLSLGVSSSEMSPASRFIALARQGLLGSDSQETPKRVMEICKGYKHHNESVSTPPMDNALGTPNLALFSPTSRRRLQAIKRGEMPSDPPKTPRNPFETSVATPDSPFGAVLRPLTGHMSVESKKKLWKFCDELPRPTSKIEPRETAAQEFKNALSKKYFSRYQTPGSNTTPMAPRQLRTSDTEETPPAKQRKMNEGQTPATPEQSTFKSDLQTDVHNSLKRLTSIMANGNSSAAKTPRSAQTINTTVKTKPTVKSPVEPSDTAVVPSSCNDSQAYTVGWDDTPKKSKVYKFILSQNINNRPELVAIINRLGGVVTDGTELDLSVTHMLYSRPAKSEKIMASIAAGIWLLHPAYILSCAEVGCFIDEEAYEWGNTSSTVMPSLDNPAEEQVATAGRRWRLVRSSSEASPFRGMRMLLHILPARRPPLVRLIVSGGGIVLDESPPYTKEVNATHCIAELQRMTLSDEDQEYLLSRKIPLCPQSFIGKLLIDKPVLDAMAYAYPAYRKLMIDRYGES